MCLPTVNKEKITTNGFSSGNVQQAKSDIRFGIKWKSPSV